jgi:hypothetical protein
MGFPQITDRMKTAPTHALRAVFSGVGRVLLAAEKAQREPAAAGQAAGTPGRENREQGYQAGQAGLSAATSRWRSLDETGNVRLLSAEDFDDECDADPAPAGDFGAREPRTVEGGPSGPAVFPAAVSPLASPLPLMSYDDLTIASIRARLRGLDTDQLRVLAEYERSHAERADVLGMLERRIEKLETSG